VAMDPGPVSRSSRTDAGPAVFAFPGQGVDPYAIVLELIY
jgi:hypothetical protein